MSQFKSRQVRNTIVFIVLLFIPILLFITSVDTVKLRDKEWNAGYDPTYAYLYNSLNMATFRIVGHVDHPGTTMQVIGGVILKVAWLINPVEGETLTLAVIKNPEYYLRILNTSVAVISSVFIFLAGLFIYKKSDALHYSLIVQSIPFISGVVLFNGFTRVSQESMLMISSMSMACWSLFWYFKNEEVSQKVFLIGFAVITGFGLASKIIFAPLVFIPLILLASWKDKFRYILLSILSFIIFTIPIIPRYPHMMKWFLSLFTHSGIYGSGKAGIIDPSQYLISLQEILNGEPVYKLIFKATLLIITTLLIIKILKGRWNKDYSFKILVAVVTAQALGYLVVAKHPGLSYLMAYESLSAINIIVILDMLIRNIRMSNLVKLILPSIILLPLLVLGINHGLKAKWLLYTGEGNVVTAKAWNSLDISSDSLAVIGVNPGPSPIAAHFFGNAYSSSRYSDSLMKVYPNHYILNTYGKQLVNWKFEEINIDSLYKKYNGNVVIVGNQFDKSEISNMLSGLDFRVKLQDDPTLGPALLNPLIHEMKISSESSDTIFHGAESLKSLDELFTGTIDFISTGNISNTKALDGSNSVLTSADSPFAFTFTDNKVIPGVAYDISVYAYGDPEKANIVVAANNLDDLYAFADKKTTNVKNGWHLINLKLLIKKQIPGEQVRIYCYNTGKEDIYFDDFTLQRTFSILN